MRKSTVFIVGGTILAYFVGLSEKEYYANAFLNGYILLIFMTNLYIMFVYILSLLLHFSDKDSLIGDGKSIVVFHIIYILIGLFNCAILYIMPLYAYKLFGKLFL